MLSVSRPLETTSFPLGQRPGLPRLASGASDSGWEPKAAYPTPPMSASPRPPLKASREANERGEPQSLYLGAVPPRDVYRERSGQLQPTGARQQLPLPVPLSRSFPQERGLYGFQRSEEAMPRFQRSEEAMPQKPLYSSHQPHGHGAPQAAYQRQHAAVAGSSSEGAYQVTSRAPALENHSATSPKSHRKPKGHVASACVPCKRAHLRCDAQRPCSRCLSNGKEDACVDVQHKKRGRPRIRDDRDTRHDPLRPPHYPDLSLRRPLSVYPPSGSGAQGLDEANQRHQPYQPLESSISGTLPHRQFGRASDGSVYGSPSPAAGYPEPVAYLTMGMEFAKASPTLLEALGTGSVTGRRLSDFVANTDAEKLFSIQSQLVAEQKRREPNYLPPILGLGGPAFEGMGFSADDVSRFPLNIQEQLTFVGPDGYVRQYPLRMGLGKEGSFFFVMMLLTLRPRYPHAAASSQTTALYREAPNSQAAFTPRTQAVPAFDPIRHRLSDGTSHSRPPLSLQVQANQASSTANPGTSSSPISPYDASASSRARYPGQAQPSHGYICSEAPLSAGRTALQRFQLPPIRAQSDHQPPARTQGWPRDERPTRVDIGGLLEKPEEAAGRR